MPVPPVTRVFAPAMGETHEIADLRVASERRRGCGPSESGQPNWSRAVLVDMMSADFSTTTNEAVATLCRNWEDDLLAFDAVYQYMVKISDALSDGMVDRFPQEFASKSTTIH
jgi:hypothetical protein